MKRDPFPAVLKPCFFFDQNMPSLISDYDAIGFEIDHCLVKYNNSMLTADTVISYLKDLNKNHSYPTEVTKFTEKLMSVFTNNIVWDIKHGLLLKIIEGKIITHAVRGFKPLSEKQIIEIYG
jgi:hypothetical protein